MALYSGRICASGGRLQPVDDAFRFFQAEARFLAQPLDGLDFLAGRVFMDPALPELAPAERSALYDEMNRVIAALHSLDE